MATNNNNKKRSIQQRKSKIYLFNGWNTESYVSASKFALSPLVFFFFFTIIAGAFCLFYV